MHETAEAGEPESMTLESFQENLPYAMVFGLAERRDARLRGILTVSPEWYEGTETYFDTLAITSSLSDIGASLYSVSSYSSSDSGGGFDFVTVAVVSGKAPPAGASEEVAPPRASLRYR